MNTSGRLVPILLVVFSTIGPAGHASSEILIEMDFSPEPGSDWQDGVTLQVTASGGTGGLNVSYRLGEGPWITYEGTPVSLPDGRYLVLARAEDETGNEAITSREVKVDSLPPDIRLDTGSANQHQLWFTEPVEIGFDADDNTSGIESFAVRVGDGPWTLSDKIRLDPLTDGRYHFWLRATDLAGNEAGPTKVHVNVDATPPTVPRLDWNSDAGGGVVEAILLSPPTDATSGVVSVILESMQDGGDWTTLASISSIPGASGSGDGPALWLNGKLPVGVNTCRIKVFDGAGNHAISEAVRIQVVGLETDGSPSSGETVRRLEQLRFEREGFEPESVAFRLDGRTLEVVTGPIFEHTWDTRTVQDGEHTVRMVGVDADGTEATVVQVFIVHNDPKNIISDNLAAVLAVAVPATILTALLAWSGVRADARVKQHAKTLAGPIFFLFAAFALPLALDAFWIVLGISITVSVALGAWVAWVARNMFFVAAEPTRPVLRVPQGGPIDFDSYWRRGRR